MDFKIKDENPMRKLIDLPDPVRWKLEEKATKEKKSLKVWIQDLLIKISKS
jgi:hypothetical protein